MPNYIYINKKLLCELYFIQKLSLKQISKKIKFNISTIEARLKEYGYKLRNKFEAKKLIDQSGINNPSYKVGKPKCENCGKELSRYDAHQCFDCYLKIVGYINRGKKRSKATKSKYSLAKGGNGIPYFDCSYPKEFYYIRKQIRQRDNYICNLCNKYGNEVHHIDYDKQNCKEDNLITLCLRCHRKTNTNRTFWQYYFDFFKNS